MTTEFRNPWGWSPGSKPHDGYFKANAQPLEHLATDQRDGSELGMAPVNFLGLAVM